MGFTGDAFQTSFVVAALVAAVFLAGRIGGDAELFRRGMQVAIGLGLVLLVFSGTRVIIRPPAVPAGISDTFGNSDNQAKLLDYTEDTANRASGAGSIHIAAATVLVGLGIGLRRLRVIPLGLVLGGVLLLLLGSPPQTTGNGSDFFNSYLLAAYPGANASQLWEFVRFVVIVCGVLVLLLTAYAKWERSNDDGDDGPVPEAPAPST